MQSEEIFMGNSAAKNMRTKPAQRNGCRWRHCAPDDPNPIKDIHEGSAVKENFHNDSECPEMNV